MRIVIFGLSGSGKSTLSVKLSQITGTPLHHLDIYNFEPNTKFKKKPVAEFFRDVEAFSDDASWIAEGAYSKVGHILYPKADLIIHLDLPLYILIPRVIIRQIKLSGKQTPYTPEGCISETKHLYPFIKWMLGFNKKYMPMFNEYIDQANKRDKLLVFKSNKAADKWLQNITKQQSVKK